MEDFNIDDLANCKSCGKFIDANGSSLYCDSCQAPMDQNNGLFAVVDYKVLKDIITHFDKPETMAEINERRRYKKMYRPMPFVCVNDMDKIPDHLIANLANVGLMLTTNKITP